MLFRSFTNYLMSSKNEIENYENDEIAVPIFFP